jgi:hypothetical protein
MRGFFRINVPAHSPEPGQTAYIYHYLVCSIKARKARGFWLVSAFLATSSWQLALRFVGEKRCHPLTVPRESDVQSCRSPAGSVETQSHSYYSMNERTQPAPSGHRPDCRPWRKPLTRASLNGWNRHVPFGPCEAVNHCNAGCMRAAMSDWKTAPSGGEACNFLQNVTLGHALREGIEPGCAIAPVR